MANQVSGNPIVLDTNSTQLTGRHYVMLIQWVDNAADIADDDDLVFVVNGQTVTVKLAMTANELNNAVVYEAAFSRPLIVDSFSLTTIDHGELLLWCA